MILYTAKTIKFMGAFTKNRADPPPELQDGSIILIVVN